MKTILLLMLCWVAQSTWANELPTADELWLRAAPPNANMLAAYVTLHNQTSENLTLVGAYAPDFGMAEIHKTIEVDGMLKMREQESLPLSSQSEIVMQPGGLHIMLMMPERSFKVGETARICLIYENAAGEELIQHLDFPVKRQ